MGWKDLALYLPLPESAKLIKTYGGCLAILTVWYSLWRFGFGGIKNRLKYLFAKYIDNVPLPLNAAQEAGVGHFVAAVRFSCSAVFGEPDSVRSQLDAVILASRGRVPTLHVIYA
jgi:hypothetical protein